MAAPPSAPGAGLWRARRRGSSPLCSSPAHHTSATVGAGRLLDRRLVGAFGVGVGEALSSDTTEPAPGTNRNPTRSISARIKTSPPPCSALLFGWLGGVPQPKAPARRRPTSLLHSASSPSATFVGVLGFLPTSGLSNQRNAHCLSQTFTSAPDLVACPRPGARGNADGRSSAFQARCTRPLDTRRLREIPRPGCGITKRDRRPRSCAVETVPVDRRR